MFPKPVSLFDRPYSVPPRVRIARIIWELVILGAIVLVLESFIVDLFRCF